MRCKFRAIVVAAALALAWLAGGLVTVMAQSCGTGNPNCLAPTPPLGDNSHRIATTEFVTRATTFAPQSANRFFAGPATGSAATPTFRAIVDADLPASANPAWTNVAVTKGAGDPITTADCKKTIEPGSNVFFTLTVGAASGYVLECALYFTNTDTWGSGRARCVAVTGYGSFLLWPQSNALVSNKNNVWVVERNTRTKLAAGPTTFKADFNNGTDTACAADGLGAVAATYFKTARVGVSTISNEFDYNTTQNGNTTLTLQLAAGTNDTSQIHCANHVTGTGAHGSVALVIDGNGATLSSPIGPLQVFFGCVLKIQNATVTSSGNHCIFATDQGHIYIGASMIYGSCNGAQIYATVAGQIEIQNSYSIAAGATQHIRFDNGGQVYSTVPVTATLTANASFSEFIYGQGLTLGNFSGFTWATGGFTYTTTNCKYLGAYLPVIFGASTAPGTTQNAGCTSSIAGQTTWLLERDLNPAANDNSPMFLRAAA